MTEQNPYISIGSKAKFTAEAKTEMSKAMERYGAVGSTKNVAMASTVYDQLVNGIYVRPGFDQSVKYFYDKKDELPTDIRSIICAVRHVYKSVGVARNVFDMMTDFAVEDIRILHVDKKAESFINTWFKTIKMKDYVSEFARHALIDCNVIVKRITATISKPVEKRLFSTVGAADFDLKVEQVAPKDIGKREIPWKYRFLNITSLEWPKTEEFSIGSDVKLWFKLPNNVLCYIQELIRSKNTKALEAIPKDIKEAVMLGKTNAVPLDMSKLYIAHNKKDSWEMWATPYLYASLPDIRYKIKLRQADEAALDGVINPIRLWKLGDHTHDIMPNEMAFVKLINTLQANPGGQVFDIVWDSAIEVQTEYPPIENILGQEKYKEVDRDILVGLGVPEVLVSGQSSGMTNGYLQLKTLIEKLETIRSMITDWLTVEVGMYCDAMDIPRGFSIAYNNMSLQDENITLRLIVGLLDRGVISVEAVLEAYGQDYLIEIERIRREKAIFDRNEVKKTSKIMVGGPFLGGDANEFQAPSESGGRPPDTKETDRKKRTPKVKANVSNMVLAQRAMEVFDSNVLTTYLEVEGIKNMRCLTADQKKYVEAMRRTYLSNIDTTTKFDDEDVVASLLSKTDNYKEFEKSVASAIDTVRKSTVSNNETLTLDEIKTIELYCLVDKWTNEESQNG